MARRCARGPRRTCRIPEGLRLSSRAGRILARGRGPAGRSLRDRRPRACSPCCASCAKAPDPRRSASVTARRISRPRRRAPLLPSPSTPSPKWPSGSPIRPLAARTMLADFAPHLEVVEQFGVRMRSFERNGRMRVCYDGELFHRVLTLPGGAAGRARACSPRPHAARLHRSGFGPCPARIHRH